MSLFNFYLSYNITMIKDNINWQTIDDKLKNLKFPLVFIYSIIKNQEKINDYDLSLIIRFFLKNQIEISMKYPLFIMCNILKADFITTKKVVSDYYSSIIKKIFFLNYIYKFKVITKNLVLEGDIIDQKRSVVNLLNRFKSHFDSSVTGINGATKFFQQLKLEKNVMVNNEIKNRYNESIELLGEEFFIKSNFKLIKRDDFDSLDVSSKIKYFIFFYLKVDKIFNQILNFYDLFHFYDSKIKQIIDPKPININFEEIFSENDSDDISMIIQS